MITMEEIIKTYAGNIRRSRQNKKVTQAVMADKIGITEKYWSDIETGRKPCSLDTLVAIANALEIEPYELLLPENKAINYDTRRAKIVMKQLKNNFSEMVDTLGSSWKIKNNLIIPLSSKKFLMNLRHFVNLIFNIA